jgi:hypothetical protein
VSFALRSSCHYNGQQFTFDSQSRNLIYLFSQIFRHFICVPPKNVLLEGTISNCSSLSLSSCSSNCRVQLIKVDWPLSVASMFDWLRFFSFSINVVRPECAFSWKFQTKVIITLLTPVGLSVLTLLSGFLYGMIASYKLWKILARERRESNKYSKISYLSVLSCWYVYDF